jgi:MoaA/NifB/PqqE/SkfB family radical SAM enzyme
MHYRHMEVYLFDTCTHKCAYCWLAEQGLVLDNTQLAPYRDPAFIEKVADFFLNRTTNEEKWLLSLTGGEPLLMPNFELFVEKLGAKGNKICIYTALLVGDNNPALRYLLERGAAHTDYLMVSFHPEAEEREKQHFERLEKLKRAGHSVIFRFVGHPNRLNRLDELARRCRDLDISFHPTTLFSPEYPAKYTAEQRQALEKHFCSLSQVVQLEGGLDVQHTKCTAGGEIFAVFLRTGNITPCISVSGPILGNIFENTLLPIGEPIRCPNGKGPCSCDVHFQQGIVLGANDSNAFEAEKAGYVRPKDVGQLKAQIIDSGNIFSDSTPRIGQTKTANWEALSTAAVKGALAANKDWALGSYAENNHPEFRKRQGLGLREPSGDLSRDLKSGRNGKIQSLQSLRSVAARLLRRSARNVVRD